MVSVPLGPFALPLNPLLMLGGWWLASAVAARLAGGHRPAARQALRRAAWAGLAGARAAFVWQAAPVYAQAPWTVLDLRDGGWAPWAGLAAALAVLAVYALRLGALRRPLLAGASAGLVAWGALSWTLGVHDEPALPALTLADLAGRAVALRPPGAGQPMVVNLWATWCAPCRTEMPLLAAAQQREPRVRFVFVNQGESADGVRRWLAAQPYRIDGVLLDDRLQLGALVGSGGLPTTLFVDAGGRVVEHHLGPLSAASLAARLDAVRAP